MNTLSKEMLVPRREFLQRGALALVALKSFGLFPPPAQAAASAGPTRKLRKGIMWSTVGVPGSVLEKMKAVKDAGFEGVEMNSHMDQEEVLRARDETGLVIPSVCGARHWNKPLSDPNEQVRAEGLAALQQTLRDAKRYGASSVLLVPAVVTKQVTYDQAWDRSRAEIRKAIPLATELGLKIAIENVGNQFLLSPLEAARYVDEFESPSVGWHFDVGNNFSNGGWPEQWIRILGKRIQKLHIKEFVRRQRNQPPPGPGPVRLLEGDNDWPSIMKAVDDIGYTGWAITEQPGGDTRDGLADLAQRLGRILAA
jgi:L-ribulose-5-phosphate 3-epimerase